MYVLLSFKACAHRWSQNLNDAYRMFGICYLIPQNFHAANVKVLPLTFLNQQSWTHSVFFNASVVKFAMAGLGLSVHYTAKVNTNLLNLSQVR